MGVGEAPGGCVISISFESRDALQSFVDAREAAGLEARRQHTKECDGNLKEIELDLSAGD